MPTMAASLIGVLSTRSGIVIRKPARHLEGAAVRGADVLAEQNDGRSSSASQLRAAPVDGLELRCRLSTAARCRRKVGRRRPADRWAASSSAGAARRALDRAADALADLSELGSCGHCAGQEQVQRIAGREVGDFLRIAVVVALRVRREPIGVHAHEHRRQSRRTVDRTRSLREAFSCSHVSACSVLTRKQRRARRFAGQRFRSATWTARTIVLRA